MQLQENIPEWREDIVQFIIKINTDIKHDLHTNALNENIEYTQQLKYFHQHISALQSQLEEIQYTLNDTLDFTSGFMDTVV